MPSASTAARVTTPWRSSRASASARARSRSDGAGSSSGSTSDQRPRAAGVPAVGRARRRSTGGGRCGAGMRPPERSGCQASLVTRPAHTSSHSAASSAPLRLAGRAATRSRKKRAPRIPQRSSTGGPHQSPTGGPARTGPLGAAAARRFAQVDRRLLLAGAGSRPPRRPRRERPAAPACSRAPAAAARPAPRRATGSATPPSWESTSRRRGSPRPMPCQAGRNRPSAGRLDRLHLPPQPRQRAPAHAPQHVRLDPTRGRRRRAGRRPRSGGRRRRAPAGLDRGRRPAARAGRPP